nr:hypothetical protein [uncultured Rhodopila sp.]
MKHTAPADAPTPGDASRFAGRDEHTPHLPREAAKVQNGRDPLTGEETQ